MTCIVALEHNGKVWMGGDSAAVGGMDIQPVANPKVFRVDDFVIGYTSSFRMGQLLQYGLSIPTNDCDDDMRFLVTKFIPAVRTCFKDGGYTWIENSRESGGSFLLGYRGKLYLVANDFQVTRFLDGIASVGCGESYALGSLASSRITNPRKAITTALEVAARLSAGVCAPFHVISL